MTNTVYFNNQSVNFSYHQDDFDVFIVLIGEGELKDEYGKNYYVRLEYMPYTDDFKREIWWNDDEYVEFERWEFKTEELKYDLEDIEEFLREEFSLIPKITFSRR